MRRSILPVSLPLLLLSGPRDYSDQGSPIGGVYAAWVSVVLAINFSCRWFARYRPEHKEKWWLSYL